MASKWIYPILQTDLLSNLITLNTALRSIVRNAVLMYSAQ